MLRVGVDGRVLVDRYHGIGRVTFELLDALAGRSEFEFTVFVDPREPAERFDLERLQGRPGIRLVDFPVALPSLAQFARWPAVLRRHRVDVMVFPYQLGATLTGRGRRVAVVHDCIFERDSRYAPSLSILRKYRLLTRVLVRRTEVVVPSKATADDVKRFYGVQVPDGNVVEWGVSPRFASLDTSTAQPYRYLLHVGARRPHKNVPFLVRVLAALPDDVHLVLVGGTDDRWPDETSSVAAELGVADRVHELHGVTDDELGGLYRHARAFVYPSAVEGFGLPLLEAMAAGAPVVASDIPVFREIGRDAARLAPLQVEAWRDAITSLVDDDVHDEAVARGRAVAGAATWQTAAQKFADVLLASPARRS